MKPKHPSLWRQIVASSFFFLSMFASVSFAHMLLVFVEHLTGMDFGNYGRMLITFFCAVFIFGLMFWLIGKWVKPRQNDYFNTMIAAFRQMAKGDFSVSLERMGGFDGRFAELSDSINQMARELKEMEKIRQEFVSNVSHEIQSPLTSIGGFARALQDDELDADERHNYLSIIEMESKRLSKISDNLLKLTMLESDRHFLESKSYRLDRQLTELILVCEPQWMAKGIQMEAELDKVTLFADEDLMSQVWTNLLQNSIKFTPQGGKVTVTLTQHNGSAECRITDTGIGIEADSLPHIFERFYKADRSRNRANSGSGLGLSLVKKIVELHGGTVTVVSEANRGTQFTVTLPVRNLS